jgi:hypothetical protein
MKQEPGGQSPWQRNHGPSCPTQGKLHSQQLSSKRHDHEPPPNTMRHVGACSVTSYGCWLLRLQIAIAAAAMATGTSQRVTPCLDHHREQPISLPLSGTLLAAHAGCTCWLRTLAAYAATAAKELTRLPHPPSAGCIRHTTNASARLAAHICCICCCCCRHRSPHRVVTPCFMSSCQWPMLVS